MSSQVDTFTKSKVKLRTVGVALSAAPSVRQLVCQSVTMSVCRDPVSRSYAPPCALRACLTEYRLSCDIIPFKYPPRSLVSGRHPLWDNSCPAWFEPGCDLTSSRPAHDVIRHDKAGHFSHQGPPAASAGAVRGGRYAAGVEASGQRGLLQAQTLIRLPGVTAKC